MISYINCTADIKALSDIIVTSSNAEKIVESVPKDQKDNFRARQKSGRLPGEEDRSGYGFVEWRLYGSRDL